jgi:hypothetical protein
MREHLSDSSSAFFRVDVDLKIPEPQDPPAELAERVVDFLVTLAVSVDLSVPKCSGLPVVVVGVSVPERAIDEHRKSSATKNEVGLAGQVLGV